MHGLFATFALVIATLASGCSALHMPLSDDAAKLDPVKPLYLMSVTIKNDYKPRWQPDLLAVFLETDNGTAKPEQLAFRMDNKGRLAPSAEDGSVATYLVRFTTEGFPHIIRGFNAMGSAFPVHGLYFMPLHARLPAAAGGAYYLGAIKAVVRERRGSEFRAGPVIPLIDQAVAGASTGTFDIEITDAYADDVIRFRKTFAALKDVEIQNKVLPAWDRAVAQQYWEKN